MANKEEYAYDDIYMSRQPNRTTTIESLEAAISLLSCTDKEKFLELYKLATHDNGGTESWAQVNSTIKILDRPYVFKSKRESIGLNPRIMK